jgi:hypothetical protein
MDCLQSKAKQPWSKFLAAFHRPRAICSVLRAALQFLKVLHAYTRVVPGRLVMSSIFDSQS